MKKRKLKPAVSRRPKVKIGIDAIVADVSKETGFTKQDIKTVYQSICKATKKRLWNGESVLVPYLGTLMPFIKPRCIRHALYGGRREPELIEVPPKWTLRFVPQRGVREEFASKPVSKEEEDAIYED